MQSRNDEWPNAVITPQSITVETEGSIIWGGFNAFLVKRGEIGRWEQVLLTRDEIENFVIKRQPGLGEWAALIRERGSSTVRLTFANPTGDLDLGSSGIEEAWVKSAGLSIKPDREPMAVPDLPEVYPEGADL